MEGRICVSSAVCRHQQIPFLIKRCLYRQQPQLTRTLFQMREHARLCFVSFFTGMRNQRSGTYAQTALLRPARNLFVLYVTVHGRLIVCRCLSFLKGERPLWTGRDTKSTASASFFLDPYDLSRHGSISSLFRQPQYRIISKKNMWLKPHFLILEVFMKRNWMYGPLFDGMTDQERMLCLQDLRAKEKSYRKRNC